MQYRCSPILLNCYDSVAVKITVTVLSWQQIKYIRVMLLDTFFGLKLLESSFRERSSWTVGEHGEEYIWVSASVMCMGRCFLDQRLVMLILCSTGVVI